jgi:hypothetical protein
MQTILYKVSLHAYTLVARSQILETNLAIMKRCMKGAFRDIDRLVFVLPYRGWLAAIFGVWKQDLKLDVFNNVLPLSAYSHFDYLLVAVVVFVVGLRTAF